MRKHTASWQINKLSSDTLCAFYDLEVSPMSFDIMKEQPGLRPAPHLASRGMLWIQWYSNETLSDDDLKSYLDSSHRLVASGLTKKKQRELGFLRD